MALSCTQIWWTTEVGIAFARLEEGYENAMKEYHKKQVTQLNTLVTMLIGQLSKGDRQKIMTICTIDVHARDVVAKMIAQKVCVCSSAKSWAGHWRRESQPHAIQLAALEGETRLIFTSAEFAARSMVSC